jgi:hypothetical protein
MQQLLHQTLLQIVVHLDFSQAPPSLTCSITDINTQQPCCLNIIITLNYVKVAA